MGIKPRVLIVEDEIIVALFMEDVLAEFGYEVAGVVGHLEEAAAREPDYDMAVLDVHLNGRPRLVFPVALPARGIPSPFPPAIGGGAFPTRPRGRPGCQKPFHPGDFARALDRSKPPQR